MLAFFAANLVIYWSTWPINWKLGVAVLIGFALLPVYHLLGNEVPALDWKSGATWVLPWLGGLMLISYLGNYDGRGVLTFETSVPIIFAFSCLIYLLAVRSRLATEEIERHIENSRKESEQEEQELESA